MTRRSQPWWYSGDEAPEPDVEGPETVDESPYEAPDEAADHDTDETAEPSADDAGPREGQQGSGIEWTALLLGAQRVVDWATERVMAPHAEHDDPAEHPQCVVCRTMVLIGESRTVVTDEEQGAGPAEEPSDPVPTVGEIMWIPIRGEGPEA